MGTTRAPVTRDLLSGLPETGASVKTLAEGAMLLKGFAAAEEPALLKAIERILAEAPLRHMVTPSGHTMSAAMSNCGEAGWISDRSGYRYDAIDPATQRPWPPMPEVFAELAGQAAARVGYDGFVPDACLINRYEPGARLSLHQDKNERDFEAPIVSVSLGLPAVFLFGGSNRADTPRRVRLAHGDVVVWGGPARLRYHGVLPLEEGRHPVMGGRRINLTFRKAL